MYACPNCGANIKFDPATQLMKCEYCGTEILPTDHMFNRSAEEEKGIDLDAAPSKEAEKDGQEEPDEREEYEVTYYTCPQCGGELITEDTTAATFCSYCGSSNILEMRVGKEKKPDYIIPFKITKDDCVREYKKTLNRAIFAPNDFRKDETIERFRGIYMPYWVYDVKAEGTINSRGKVQKRRGDYIYTSHYAVESDVDIDYNGFSYDASSSFEDRLSEAIAPFDIKDSTEFRSSYLSGFYADTSDVDNSLYGNDAKQVVLSDAAKNIFASPEYSKHGVSAADIAASLEKKGAKTTAKFGMFPVWFLSNKNGDRVSYAVVNGQTGKVAMDIPIDILKYFLGVLIISVPLSALLILSNILIGPRVLIMLTMVISLIVLILANKQANNLFAREILFDDKGYNSKRTGKQVEEYRKLINGNVKVKKAKIKSASGNSGFGTAIGYAAIAAVLGNFFGAGLIVGLIVFIVLLIINAVNSAAGKNVPKDRVIIKAPTSMKISVTIFPIITLAVGGLILLFNPFQDPIYYGVAILGMVMTGYTVARLVGRHNKLSGRKLPQFNKRGGDENED